MKRLASNAAPRPGFALFRSLIPPNGFTEHATTTYSWWLKDGQEDALLKALEGINAGTADRLQGGRGTIHRVPFDRQSPAIVRRYRRGGFVRHFIHDLYWDHPPRPFAELGSTVTAHKRGVPTVEVLGAGVEWTSFGLYRGTLITREAQGFINWWEWLQTKPPAEERQIVTEKILQTINTMHAAGIYHADLNLTNILVRIDSDRHEVRIIDFDRARLSLTALPSSHRKRNLARLQRSMTKLDPEGQLLPLVEQRGFYKA